MSNGFQPATLKATSGDGAASHRRTVDRQPRHADSSCCARQVSRAGVFPDRGHGASTADAGTGQFGAEVQRTAGDVHQIDGEPQRLGGGDDAEDVRGAGRVLPRQVVVLDAVRRHLALGDHVAAVEERQRLRQQVLLRVQHADPERRQELVEGERQVVDVQLLHVDPAARHQLGAVDEQQGPALTVRLRVTAAVGDRPDRPPAAAWCPGSWTPRCSTPAWSARRPARPGGPGRAAPVTWSNRATRHSTRRPNRGRISRHSAYQGTKLELCSSIVVTTLSPSRNSVSSEYMTALMRLGGVAVGRDAAPARRVQPAGDGVVGRLEQLGRAPARRSTGRGARSRTTGSDCGTDPAAAAAAACSPRCW